MALIKLFANIKKNLINQIFTNSIDYSSIVKEILNLFYLQLTPQFHIIILKNIQRILEIETQLNFGNFMYQITTQYPYFQKILKDVTSL